MSSSGKKEIGSLGKSSATSSPSGSPLSKGFIVLLGIDELDPDPVVRALVDLRKEKGWSSRLFSLHSIKGAEGLYDEWCDRLSGEVRRLRVASSSSLVATDGSGEAEWKKVVPGQFDDA